MISEKKVNNLSKKGKVFIQSAITHEWKSRNCELNGSFLTFYRKDKIVAVIDLEQVGDINLVRDVHDTQGKGTIFTIYLKEGRYFTIRAINVEEGTSWVHILLEVRDKLRSQISRRSRPGSFCSMPDTSKNLERLITDLSNISRDNDEEDVKTYFNKEKNPPSPILNDLTVSNDAIISDKNVVPNSLKTTSQEVSLTVIKSHQHSNSSTSPLRSTTVSTTTTVTGTPPRRVSFSFPMTDRISIPVVRNNVLTNAKDISNLHTQVTLKSTDKRIELTNNNDTQIKEIENITTYNETNKENHILVNTSSESNNNTILKEVITNNGLNTHSSGSTIGSPSFRKANSIIAAPVTVCSTACEVNTTSIRMQTNDCTLNTITTVSKKIMNSTYTSPVRTQKQVSSFSTQTPSYKRNLKAVTSHSATTEYSIPAFAVVIITIIAVLIGYISSQYYTLYNSKINYNSDILNYMNLPPLSADEISQPKLLYITNEQTSHSTLFPVTEMNIYDQEIIENKIINSISLKASTPYNHILNSNINNMNTKVASDKHKIMNSVNTTTQKNDFYHQFTKNSKVYSYNRRKQNISIFFQRLFNVPVVRLISNIVRRITSVFQKY